MAPVWSTCFRPGECSAVARSCERSRKRRAVRRELAAFLGAAPAKTPAWGAWLSGPADVQKERAAKAKEQEAKVKAAAALLLGAGAVACALPALPALHGVHAAHVAKAAMFGRLFFSAKAKLSATAALPAPKAAGMFLGFDSFAECWADPKGQRRISLLVVLVLWLASGTVLGSEQDGLSAMQLVYSFLNMGLTVGFGDIEPKTPLSRYCMAVFVIMNMVLVVNLLDELLKRTAFDAERFAEQELDELQGPAGPPKAPKSNKDQAFYKLLKSFGVLVGFIALGTLVNLYLNPCDCPDDGPERKICVAMKEAAAARSRKEGFDVCMAHGGTDQNGRIGMLLYGVIGTVSTLGAGSFVARGDWNKLIWCCYTLCAFSALGHTIINFLGWAYEFESEIEALSCDEEDFDEMDRNGDGQISRYEFVTYVLQQYELAKPHDLAILDQHFSRLDTSGDGYISVDELRAYFGKQKGDGSVDRAAEPLAEQADYQ